MNDVSFELAPIVELIAELRWSPPGFAPPAPGQVTLAFGAEIETFYMQFYGAAAQLGYTQAERILPPNVPAIVHNVVWRFRKPGDPSTLLQIGPGLFSANALPPYKRWSEFRPVVESAVDALVKTRLPAERELPFTGISLRYMNAFRGDLLANQPPAKFLQDVLKIHLQLPEALSGLVAPNSVVSANSNVLLPLANTTKVMSIAVGDGQANNEPAAVFDVTVADKVPVQATVAAVMKNLSESRDTIHNAFLALTEPIRPLMKQRT